MSLRPTAPPAARLDGPDARFLERFGADPADADLLVAGVPYDASVLGRKGTREGPAAIREAFRSIANHDPDAGASLETIRVADLGDVADLDEQDVRASHLAVTTALAPAMAGPPMVLLGGDHGLTYAHVRALHEARGGRIGIVVIDAHYDLRSYDDQPTSGTPFRRILEELEGAPVRARNIAEVGIRPFANARSLADHAAAAGVQVFTMGQVRSDGIASVTKEALAAAADGVDHLWLSVDIDGLDQSIASGCSAPGAGGLWFHEAAHLVAAVARHPACRGMDLLEVAPTLDPTGNTARTAAQLVATFAAATTGR